MTSKAESASKRRCTLLLLIAVAFPLWQIPLTDTLSDTTQQYGLVYALSTLGMVVWTIALIWFIALGRKIDQDKDPSSWGELDDELVRANRARAFTIGYLSAVVTAAALLMLDFLVPLTGKDVARLVIVVCVVVPALSFVTLERKHG